MVLGSLPWLDTLAMEGCLGAGMSLRMVGTPYTYGSSRGRLAQSQRARSWHGLQEICCQASSERYQGGATPEGQCGMAALLDREETMLCPLISLQARAVRSS